MIDLKAIRAAAEAATPGPWEAAGPSFGAPLPKYLNEVGRINEDEMFEEVCVSPSPEDDACSADMIFIATANPTAILELLGRLEAAEKDAAQIRNEALEEAALKCDELSDASNQIYAGVASTVCAQQIRSMKK